MAELHTQRRAQRIGRHILAAEVIVALLRIADFLDQAGDHRHAKGRPLVFKIGAAGGAQREADGEMFEFVGVIVCEGGGADQQGGGEGQGGEAGAKVHEGFSGLFGFAEYLS